MAAWLLAAVGLLIGVAGVVLYLAGRKRSRGGDDLAMHRLPRQWPLLPRALTSSAEGQAWHWLRQVFPGHHVMLKLPVTRFTMARELGAADQWFHVLRGAYCTFTVCDDEGRVIGCVDLAGPHGMARGARQLKQSLLDQCGISYWVLKPDALSQQADQMRADFLGAPARRARAETSSEQARLEQAHQQLRRVLDRRRSARPHAGGGDSGSGTPGPAARPQRDSFLGPLDSRRAMLRRR